MNYSRKIGVVWLLCLMCFTAFSQHTRFSLATDVNVLRSFKKQQQYWAIGQTITVHFHFTPKDGAYAWLIYYTNGKFNNQLTATAKLPATIPQQIAYNNAASMNFKHVSFGWKHYLKGTSDSEKWNLYAYAGWGLMLGRVENTHSVFIDTADYDVPVLAGKANFKRLTFDLAIGYEIPVGGDIYFFAEGRTLLPITDYPSNYLFINKDAPFTASVNLGIRVMFD